MQLYLYFLITLDIICFSYSAADNYDKNLKKHVSRRGARERLKDDVQFDLADFMKTEKSKDVEKEGLSYMSQPNDNPNADYLNSNDNVKVDNSDYSENTNNEKDLNKNLKDLLFMEQKNHHNDKEGLIDDDRQMFVDDLALHNPEKKCTSTTKSRKSKKTKINSKDRTTTSTKRDVTDNGPQKGTKLEKRFLRKFRLFGGKTKKENMVHNSRQSAKSSSVTTSSSLIKTVDPNFTRKNNMNFDYDSLVQEDNMSLYQAEETKEDEGWNRDFKIKKDRNLQELEELERRVENIQIDSVATKPSARPH